MRNIKADIHFMCDNCDKIETVKYVRISCAGGIDGSGDMVYSGDLGLYLDRPDGSGFVPLKHPEGWRLENDCGCCQIEEQPSFADQLVEFLKDSLISLSITKRPLEDGEEGRIRELVAEWEGMK